mmetsp:Transcript_32028/g.47630  ORF Transcript_32028/g.47630 Transcript_32028/m.47630 type:complete len:704 (-) Transcript_32028:565-2676(-)|eukprot:CAMPEP_0194063104 /NCGR_PEP_ID=MMETSP0009_2-20130614/79446_1 /TAXON_ID=210454 /ORGANISM="Grammatophora oceanica, Strain CCMP 410" /LENGTH=703 /DNA_ID=CAMNT_0038715097 /DNA_START=80 /DNA_END=2191 /DNA_ORIENTATION=+
MSVESQTKVQSSRTDTTTAAQHHHAAATTAAAAAAALEFSVMIVASGPTRTGGMVHAVAVTQPVQCWTVLRSHDDFVAVGEALAQSISGLPACPTTTHATNNNNSNANSNAPTVASVASSRNDMQDWLANILMHPGVRDSPAIRNFLTFAANMVPPQFEQVSWVNFDASGRVMPTATASTTTLSTGASSTTSGGAAPTNGSASNLDDMMMDDMFFGGDDVEDEGDDEDVETDTDVEDYVGASVRYAATDEPITQEDEMEIMGDEVEMVEDVGSLAQSMGLSHLGRSLQLQAELGVTPKTPPPPTSNILGGVRLGAAPPTRPGGGGVGSVIAPRRPGEVVVSGLGDSFHPTKPVSAPRLDSFKMIKVVGKGSFGKVFLVREKATGEMFALKVLRKDNIIKRNQVEHTKTERSVLGYVSHPFIVSMNMAFQSKDKLYFVLDYCAGGELFFHLGKLGKFPEPRARFYASEIILAISYVHTLDIIYRDLKPENVLLDARGHVRLTDFGLSKEGISDSSSGANSFCGTPEYLAPEILNRQGHGRAVDWWSLGALLYEMLTGLPPFYCQDREKLFEKIRKANLDYPASLSPPSKNLLRGLLTRDPNQRLGSGPRDAEDIKEHPFFGDIDWEKLAKGEIPPPWKPKISSSQDTSLFDKEFTNMPIFSPQNTPQHFKHMVASQTPVDNPFEGFTFTDRTLHGPSAGAQGVN